MIDDKLIYSQLDNCLDETDFQYLGEKYAGKVRECYRLSNEHILLITTDRLSCFDRVVTLVPFKGQVLNQLALFWFEKVKDIIPTHVINSPDPNVIIGKSAKTLPVEVVVRNYLTGSAWRDYQSGKDISGVRLPAGMRKDQKLDRPVLTPSTKAEKNDHDMPISEEQIVSSNLVSKKTWEQVREYAMSLFERGAKIASEQGLILVDTKYEFGFCGDELTLIDEIHTLDSSRYWVSDEYETRFQSGQEQLMLDKEPIRQWLISQGFMGEGKIPNFTDEHRVSLSRHYINAFERISGTEFSVLSSDTENNQGSLDRLEQNIKKYLSR